MPPVTDPNLQYSISNNIYTLRIRNPTSGQFSDSSYSYHVSERCFYPLAGSCEWPSTLTSGRYNAITCYELPAAFQAYLYYMEPRLEGSPSYSNPCGIEYPQYHSFVYLDTADGQPLAKLPFSFPAGLDSSQFSQSNINQPADVKFGATGTRKYTAVVYVEPSVVAEALALGRGPFGLRFVDETSGETVPSPRNIAVVEGQLQRSAFVRNIVSANSFRSTIN
eukprot:tig00020603_g11818.t1